MNTYNLTFDRRHFLAGAVAAATVSAIGLRAGQSQGLSMRALAASKGLLFGAAVRDPFIKDPRYANIVGHECSIVSPEWALKWDTVRPSVEHFDFLAADRYLQFAQDHKLLARGHTLVWHEALPKWFTGTVNSRNARTILLDHISITVRRYAGKMHSWDVVNEIVQTRKFLPNGLRDTPWLEFIGPGYIEEAFHAAHEADPNAMLVYNEDQLEPDNARAEAKRQLVLSLLKDLRSKNVPVQALGIESHIQPEGWTASVGFGRFLEEVSDLGLSILVTEMDVCDQNFVGDIVQRDGLVANAYYQYLSFLLKFPAVKAVLTWGFSDQGTWLGAHNPRSDGLPVRPLPFDAELKPKQAWTAIRRAFEEAPARGSELSKARAMFSLDAICGIEESQLEQANQSLDKDV